MTENTERETSKQRVIRPRSDARKPTGQRAHNADESDKTIDEMIRRSIELHGA